MSMNHIQFQPGLSMPEFIQQYGTEAQCEKALMRTRWPQGFCCPKCGYEGHCVLHSKNGLHSVQCLPPANLPLTTWFLAIYFISQAKTGLSALALKRHLGVSYPTAWLMQHKLMQAMAKREDHYLLSGSVQMDGAYLSGERSGGKATWIGK